jgi:hypothetical protein
MTIRTDLQFKDGAVHVRDNNRTDMREKLPEVKLTDRLASTKWGQSVRKDAGSHADDPALRDFESAHTIMANGAQKLVAQRESQNPGQTQAAHLADVHAQYERYLGSGARSMDKARANIKSRIGSIDSEFRQRAKFSDNGAGSEIRAVVRGMSDQQRAEFIANAISNEDGEALGAILDGHPSLSGLTKGQIDNHRQRAMQQLTPDLLKLERSLKKADEILFQTFDEALGVGDTLTAKDVRARFDAEARKACKARQEAQDSWGG